MSVFIVSLFYLNIIVYCRQYMSAIFCHGEEQLQLAKKSAQKAEVLKTDKYLGVYIMQNTIVE